MKKIFTGICARLYIMRFEIQRLIFRRWFRKNFSNSNYCFISQNCIGGRFYELSNRSYTSPTVGLWFEPTDFLKFCENLERNLSEELKEDIKSSEGRGYPVGEVGGSKIWFMHYPDFVTAKATWDKRKKRVEFDNVFILMTDRDGFSMADLSRFESLPTNRKILFSHKDMPGKPNVIFIPDYESESCVGDLYVSYQKFNPTIVRNRLSKLLS